MARKKPLRLKIGPDGEITLPEEVLEALGVKPGDELKASVDRKERLLRLRRFVEDLWEEAAREKESKSFEDLMSEQSKREEEARRAFEEGLEKPPEIRPEDNKDLWR